MRGAVLTSGLGSDDYFQQRSGDILFIGFQEQLSEDFEILKRLLSLPAQVALPEDDVAAHRNPPTADRHFDHEARSNMAVWYAQDRRFVEQCREIRRRGEGDHHPARMTSIAARQ